MSSSSTSFFGKQWFLCGLVVVMLLGCFATDQLAWMTEAKTLRACIVALVIFLTTLPVETSLIRATLRRPAAPLLATLINFGILPLMGWGLAQLLSGDLAIGFMVLAASPCTVASAAVWTRRAGGNDIVALMVTVITNATCFLFTSMWVGWMTNGSVDVSGISPGEMIRKLAILILLPMTVAQLLRQIPVVAEFAGKNKRRLSVSAQIGLLLVVAFGAVHCGLGLRNVQWSESDFGAQVVWMLLLCVIMHTTCLFLGRYVGEKIGLAKADWIAVGFAGSQKTLVIGLQVALMIGGGFVILPMVAYHFLQLFVDTLVADRMGD